MIDYVLKETGVFIHPQLIQHNIHKGKAGISAGKPDSSGKILSDLFVNMLSASIHLMERENRILVQIDCGGGYKKGELSGKK